MSAAFVMVDVLAMFSTTANVLAGLIA